MKLHLPKNLRIAILSCLAVASGIATTVGTGFVVGGFVAIAFVAAHAQAEINNLPANVNGDDAALDLNQPDVKLVSTSPDDEMGNYGSGNSVTPDIIDSASTEFNNVVTRMLADGVTLLQEAYGNPPLTIIKRQSGSCEYADYESISFEDIDDGYNAGGAIYGYRSTITLSDNGSVTFSGNKASSRGDSYANAYGGAIYGNMSTITLSDNDSVTFSENTASTRNNRLGAYATGGAISGDTITLSGNDSVTFIENTASSRGICQHNYASGGAIYGDTITLSDNGSVTFSGNTASSSYSEAYGGAISGDSSSTITLSGNESVTFSGNTACSSSSQAWGGAISVGYDGSVCYDGTITLSGNESVTFSGNTASSSSGDSYANAYGGAIYGAESTITLSGNKSVTFSGNTASSSVSAYGGAISGYSSNTITLSENGSVTFSGNTASSSVSASGGAIFGDTITLSDNGSVTFSGNTACSSVYASGSAIEGVTITLSDNGSVTFSGNTASSSDSASSGAIYGETITLSDNEIVTFSGNMASSSSGSYGFVSGGAIFGETITLSDNGSVTFSGNTASSSGSDSSVEGGAIYTYGDGNLNIRNNDSVLFEKNAEIQNGSYRLRSIYAESTISFSAGEGKSIDFRDSIYINFGSTVNFNADYTDKEGVVHKQNGDIIFTGATTEADLLAVKGSAGTAQEILSSRTSEVYTMTNLYGGRLRIEDGAIYKGNGITVAEGANATLLLKYGELRHAGCYITISSGSTLSAVGESKITAYTLTIQDGGTMHLALDMSQANSAAVLTTTGNLSMGNISFDLTGTEYLVAGDYKLLTRTEGVNYDISGWTLNGVTSEQLRWENGTLYYTANHDWNHGVTDDDDISDLEEIIGNLVINGGDITLDDVVQAIQDAVDAGFGHGQGHIVINRGGIHISGAGDLDGHIIFNGDLKDIRKLFIEKDITSIKIELGGSSEAENIVAVGEEYTVEIDELSGDGGMSKTGQGEMVVHGNGHKVGGTVAVQEGALTFTVGNQPAGGENPNSTEVHELVVGNDDDKDARVQVNEGAQVVGDKLHVNGKHAVVTNDGSMEFTEEVRVKGGRLNNNGAISRVTLEGGKVTGSGSFAGLEMLGGELVVGNSPGLQTYTDDVELTEGIVTFSLADAGTAATADTYGWSAAAYSTIDMSGNALTIGADVRFVLEIDGGALEALTAADDATLTFSLSLIQNIATESLTLNSEALAELLSNTSIIITSDAEGLTAGTLFLAGRDITSMLSNGEYSYEGNTLVFTGTVTNDGSLTVPEPTTATLSLLALAALASRRRR